MYAVIGAGPMGLSMARNLQKQGLPFIGFEIHSDVGGLWDITSPTSTMYESAHLISSKGMTEFAEFPMAEDVATYPHHSELRQYFRDYAKHFNLYPHFRFNTEVLSLSRSDTGWVVTSRSEGQELRQSFQGVMLCNGTLHKPHKPALPGDFDGHVMHSADYKSPEVFHGQRVLIVGCGNSGADIAVDAVHHANSVDMSVRRGYYFLPKFLKGQAIDTLGGVVSLPRPLKQRIDAALIRAAVGRPSDYGFPDPDYRLYESHPVMNTLLLHHAGHGDVGVRPAISAVQGSTVQFSDGSEADYDLILQATGYELDYPFVDSAELHWQGAAPQLYMNIFHPEHDDIFMLGMVEASGLGWEGRNQQAALVATYLKALDQKTPAAAHFKKHKQQHADKRLDGGYAYLPLDRMAYYVNKASYLKALNKHLRQLSKGLAATPSHSRARAA
nr:NAD(P)-binding domain-containing protein [Oceanococcus sp. HetDA_MAG_MS8]